MKKGWHTSATHMKTRKNDSWTFRDFISFVYKFYKLGEIKQV